jgi:Flp pilus assembly protein TadD
LKCFRNRSLAAFARILWPCCAALLLVPAIVSGARATAPWRNAESGSAIEAALYRWMPMPVSKVFGLRPPREATPLLTDLIRRQPGAELYSLRALNEEAALDFTAAEADWKKYAEAAPDRVQAQWSLADFYHRRLRPADEIASLTLMARAPAPPAEKLTPLEQQRSWLAFERIFHVIAENALPADVSEQSYRAWLDRYPAQQAVYARYFQFLLDRKSFAEVEKLIARYHAELPADEVLPIKERALLAYRSGSIEQGLAIYDTQFQPLWPQELIDSYFALMSETRSLRTYLDQARAAVERNPDDLNAAARIFYFYQRQGRADAAQQALTQYRLRKQRRNAKWNSQELYTLAKLNEGIRNYPEAARYYYALYNTSDRADAPELALSGLINVLLDAPEQGIRLGAGELSMYRDIGAMDRGPGFLNGILSLVLNTTSPAYAYSEEEQRAVPYFHRAEAAQLIHQFEARFPNSTLRPGLEARLIETYAACGESAAVIRDGQQFLKTFSSDPERERVGLLLADAYARENRTPEEFAFYDEELAALARRSDGVPLGMKANPPPASPRTAQTEPSTLEEAEAQGDSAPSDATGSADHRAFSTKASPAVHAPKSASAWYSDYLERYLSRLASLHQLPQALAVLRKEVDRNPNDPGLYERLAQFLEQNKLGQEQEQVYERAMQQFPDRSWYHKLARLYLRQKRTADFSRLSEQVVKIFSGTELDDYFSDVMSGAQYYTRLNEFAHARFPHDLVFVRNLLRAYQAPKAPRNDDWESLLRQHWWEAADLRDQYFEYLSRTGRLDQELAELQQAEASPQHGQCDELAGSNPVAARFAGEAEFWASHFEEAAPVMYALAQQYPADIELGRRASAVQRSLAAFDPRHTELAVKIEENLSSADPGDRDTLARIGDVLADRELFDRAAPYWNRVAQIRPGEPQAYLDAATIYWDYYDFDSALKMLNQGRSRLADPSLYAYESGAIYEGKREFPQAIAEYIKGASAEHEGSRPYNRLLNLARRKSLRDEVDRATAPLTAGAAPAIDAIKLRVVVLETQNRPRDVEQLLAAVGERTTSLETLEWLEETARQKSLPTVQEKVLEKQSAVTTDPVRKLELRYALVRFYEAKKDIPQARRSVEALYRENPKILGVVRATVDFFWQNQERQRAVDVLRQAANDSYPTLSAQFRFEAARKASDCGQYEPSRQLLTQLLSAAPYNEEYLAAMADTFARAGDDDGLKRFSLETIEQFDRSQLPPDVRAHQIAALRRGLIPALTHRQDYAGAVDQYIEVINRYPEDDALISEAALYAQRNGRRPQLLDYYADTIKRSPRDSRWPIVLAKLQTQVEDYAAAIDTYAIAIGIRPDRVDLRTARAELLERLMRFDESAAEYQKLFELNYHDTRWMEKVAEIRARQGKAAEAVAALSTALIENRPEKPASFFAVATRLEAWGLLQPAREFAQKGVDSAGRDLLATPDNHEGARLYVAIMTRLRQQDAAYARLQLAQSDATSLVAQISVAVKQVEKSGIAAVTDRQWRERALEARRDNARTGMQTAMQAMGKSVAQYFTPEEKLQFASWLESRAANAGNDELAARFLPAATAAVLPDLEARWLQQLMLANYSGNSGAFKSQLIELQTRRMRFAELGAALEAYAQKLTPQQGRNGVLVEAANTYRSGALHDAEFRVLKSIGLQSGDEIEHRYFELLLQRAPRELVQLAASSRNGVGDAASQYVLAHGSAALAQDSVAARGRSLDPVWTKAYSALTGLYFSDRAPAVNAAFLNALGDGTIGERLGKPVDRTQQLAGNTWFYYGSRYGEWLGVSRSGDPEDFLPAQLEQSPASAAGYITLAEYYAGAGQIGRAVDDYRRTLELADGRADIHDRIAVLYWRQQKHSEAIEEWKKALELLDAQVHQRVVPPIFWPTFGYVMNHLGNRHVAAELRPQSDAVLRDYVRQNGAYQVDGLLRSAYLAIGDPQSGVNLLLELARIAPDPAAVLDILVEAQWIPAKMRNPIYEQIIVRLEDRLRTTGDVSRQYAEDSIRSWQSRYAMHLVEQREFDHAASVLQPQQDPTTAELEIRYRISLARDQFDAILAEYRANPEKAPKADTLRTVAAALQTAGQRPAARKLLEFLFVQEIAAHQLNAANMLGLAEIRLEDGDTAAAMEVLRRLVLVVGQPFENLDPAATLLAHRVHHAEAVEFLSRLVKASPWDETARLHLAQEEIAAGQDGAGARSHAAAVATDAHAAYADRLAAAAILTGSGPALGSHELDFIAHATGSADQPYFYAARLGAASKTTDASQSARLLGNALADAPDGAHGEAALRVPLFHALAALKQDRLALASIEPLLRSGYLAELSGQVSRSYPEDVEPEDATSSTSDAAPEVIPATGVPDDAPPGERAALAIMVAKCNANLGALETALHYYRTALGGRLPDDARAEVTRNMRSVQALVRRNANNVQRMPVIHKDLEQDHLVRPRLVAAQKAPPPAKSDRGTKGGLTQ